MNAWAAPAAIGLLVGLAYGYRAWRSAARRLAAIQEEFKTPAPAASTPRAPGPDPGLTPHEHAALARYATLAGIAIPAGHVLAGREIADGLRQRFPAVDDATLGTIALDLHGYAVAVGIGVPSAAEALQALINCYAMAAEDLTRLHRTEGAPFDGI